MKAPTRGGIAYSSALSDNNVLLIGTEGSWVQAFSEPKKLLWERKLREAVVSVSISLMGGVRRRLETPLATSTSSGMVSWSGKRALVNTSGALYFRGGIKF